jgi:hypothetical protein
MLTNRTRKWSPEKENGTHKPWAHWAQYTCGKMELNSQSRNQLTSHTLTQTKQGGYKTHATRSGWDEQKTDSVCHDNAKQDGVTKAAFGQISNNCHLGKSWWHWPAKGQSEIQQTQDDYKEWITIVWWRREPHDVHKIMIWFTKSEDHTIDHMMTSRIERRPPWTYWIHPNDSILLSWAGLVWGRMTHYFNMQDRIGNTCRVDGNIYNSTLNEKRCMLTRTKAD